MRIPLYQVDAFTNRALGGNPAAVCPLEQWIPEATMRGIAIETNLPATAFFVPRGEAFDIRWFTPASELDLCGHGTLAASHVLLNILEPSRKRLRFSSRGGPFEVFEKGGRPVLEFPAIPPTKQHDPALVTAALGRAPVELWEADRGMAVFETAEQVQALDPDPVRVAALPFLGVIATAPSGSDEVDFVSRYFAPKIGIPEDAATGSAHCVLAPYWSKRLGRSHLTARQISRRGGELWLENRNDRVYLSGHCVVVLQGTLTL